MSVRRVYSVLVNGEIVFSGSYRSALNVYESFERFSIANPDVCVDLVMIFKPSVNVDYKKGDEYFV